MSRQDVYRDGKVHVLSEQCATCIFRPGNLMQLQGGRVKGMLDDCEKSGGVIPCHSTIYREDVRPAICRGFFDHRVGRDNITLRLAAITGALVEEPPPSGEEEL